MRRLYITPFLLVALMTACYSPAENANAPGTSAAQQTNANTATTSAGTAQRQTDSVSPLQPSVGQDGATPAPLSATAPSVAKVVDSPVKPDATAGGPNSSARLPQLVVLTRELDLGKQPKDANLTRTILVKNIGKADLEIESVVPS